MGSGYGAGMQTKTSSEVFVDTLAARDFGALAGALAPDAVAHFLLPRGPQETVGGEAIARRFEGWFGGAEKFTVVATGNEPVGRRRLLQWRFQLCRDGITDEVIEQVAFADEGPDGISRIDLVCSGFLAAD